MKIVDLKTFLNYPDGVVFAEYKHGMLGDIEVRGTAYHHENLSSCAYQHFGLLDTEETLVGPGAEAEIVTDSYYRRGPGLDPTQLFAVLDKKDIATIIERLQRAHNEAKE